MEVMEQDRWLTTNEILDEYPVGKTRLYEVLSDGSLESIRWGRKYLVRESDMESFFSESSLDLF